MGFGTMGSSGGGAPGPADDLLKLLQIVTDKDAAQEYLLQIKAAQAEIATSAQKLAEAKADHEKMVSEHDSDFLRREQSIQARDAEGMAKSQQRESQLNAREAVIKNSENKLAIARQQVTADQIKVADILAQINRIAGA